MSRPAFTWRVAALAYILITAVFVSACERQVPALKVKPGQRIPDLPLWDFVQQREQRLNTASGKWLILNVWATWCGPCRYELPSLDRLSQILDENRFSIVGLSVDDDEHVLHEFLRERKIQFQNYVDKGKNVTNGLLGVRVFPSTFVVGPDGELKKVIEGWREWDSPESQREILALSKP